MPGLFDNTGPGGGILGGLSNFLANGAAAGSPAIAQSQLAQREFAWKMQLFQQQAEAMRARGIPDDQIYAIMQDPNGPAAQMQYGPPKQYQGPEYTGEGGYKPAGPVYMPNGTFQQPTNIPQPAPQMMATPQNRVAPGTPQATQTIGGPATAGVPQELQQAAPIMDYLHAQKAQQVAAEAKAKEQGESAAKIDADVSQIDRSIKLIDELSVHPGMKWATGMFANIPGGPPKGTQAYAFTKGVGQLKDQITLGLMPVLQRMRTSPAVLEFLNKATGGQELDLGSPDFGKNLKDTRDALVQIRADAQKGAGAAVTAPPSSANGLPTFNTQADLRAAIKAKTIKIGDPFRTGDGRTLMAQ